MDNDSGDRSIPVQAGENNDSGEQSPNPVSQERHRNEKKDSLANRSKNLKAEWQKERKKVENGKFLLVEKIQILRQLTLIHQQKKKKKPKRRRHHQPKSSSSLTTSDSSTDEESRNDSFKIVTENKKFKWKLRKIMTDYANKYFEE